MFHCHCKQLKTNIKTAKIKKNKKIKDNDKETEILPNYEPFFFPHYVNPE